MYEKKQQKNCGIKLFSEFPFLINKCLILSIHRRYITFRIYHPIFKQQFINLSLYFLLQVELGANWIHGVLGNPIFEIAVQHGLVSVVNVPKPHKVVATTEDGLQVPFNILQEIYEAYVCFLRRCDEYFLCQYSPPPDINSVGEHINYEIQIYLSSVEDPKEKHLKQLIFNCLLKRETCITGCTDMNEVDLLELGKLSISFH